MMVNGTVYLYKKDTCVRGFMRYAFHVQYHYAGPFFQNCLSVLNELQIEWRQDQCFIFHHMFFFQIL